jgi:phosphatidylinositol dimannoside acyltransferase
MAEHLSYYAYLIGWKFVALLPERAAYSLFSVIATRLYKRNGKSIKRLRRNFEMVNPDLQGAELETVVLEGTRSYMRYWCDTFRIHNWTPSRIESTVTTTNEDLLLGPMQRGEGVIIALPHSGNWDHAGAYFCQKGVPLVTVAEVLKPAKLFEKFLTHRQRMGFEVLGLDSRAFVTLIRRAKEKRLIALVADRDLSDSGIPVNFFGHEAKMPAGPALLALKTGLPLVVAHVSYTKVGIHIDFRSVTVVQSGDDDQNLSHTVANIAAAFEVGISEHLVDWHMLQRIWTGEEIYQ